MTKLLSIIILLFVGCEEQPLNLAFEAMDTYCSVVIFDHTSGEMEAEVKQITTDLEERISSFIPSSQIAQLNSSQQAKLDKDIFTLLQVGIEFSVLSDGAFDLSIKPLSSLWNINGDESKVPARDEIARARALVNYKNISLDEESHTVSFLQEGMSIDLGSIGKGLAADLIKAYLQEQGVQKAIINLGGNVLLLGKKYDKHKQQIPWNIAIRDLALGEADNQPLVLNLTQDLAIVTSGIHERFFTTEDAKVYHHIIDPATGYPSDNELSSTTVVHEKAREADALSTTFFVLGLEAGLQLANEQAVLAIFITKDKTISLSRPLLDAIQQKTIALNLLTNSYSFSNYSIRETN